MRVKVIFSLKKKTSRKLFKKIQTVKSKKKIESEKKITQKKVKFAKQSQ